VNGSDFSPLEMTYRPLFFNSSVAGLTSFLSRNCLRGGRREFISKLPGLLMGEDCASEPNPKPRKKMKKTLIDTSLATFAVLAWARSLWSGRLRANLWRSRVISYRLAWSQSLTFPLVIGELSTLTLNQHSTRRLSWAPLRSAGR
jgi:hypothetical protein